MAKVLILDQSKSMRNTLRERLEYEGFSTEAAEDEEAASNMCEKIPFDVILSDTGCKIPDKGVPFIVLSSEASIDSAVEAVRNGAQDYLTKPIDMNRLLQSIHRTIDDPAPVPAPAAAPARRTRRGHNAQTEHIIGTSPQIEHVRLLIDKVAPCEARVLITGENGTGKELVARWLHAKSNRAAAPFVEVNCAAIPSELIESELFGHERGAFTSAIKQRRGKFEQADGGTLFMDEIGDMSLAAQAKVLRALQENRISRVGSDKDIEVNVRVIAATNKNLREEIRKGNFREDLYHRIGVVVVRVPALREHAQDIPLLVDHFIRTICAEYHIPAKRIEEEALSANCATSSSGSSYSARSASPPPTSRPTADRGSEQHPDLQQEGAVAELLGKFGGEPAAFVFPEPLQPQQLIARREEQVHPAAQCILHPQFGIEQQSPVGIPARCESISGGAPGIGRKAAAAHKQELRIGKERHERFFIAGNPRSGTDRKPAAHIVMTRHAPDDGHRRRAGQAEARPYGRRTGKAGQLLRRHLGGKERQHAQRRGQYSGSPRHRTRIVMRSTIRSAEVSPEISGSIPPELPSGLLWPTSTASNSSLPDDRSTSAA